MCTHTHADAVKVTLIVLAEHDNLESNLPRVSDSGRFIAKVISLNARLLMQYCICNPVGLKRHRFLSASEVRLYYIIALYKKEESIKFEKRHTYSNKQNIALSKVALMFIHFVNFPR